MSDGVRIEECAVLRPGDKLVLRVDPRCTPDQLHALADGIRERLTDNEVLILGFDGQMLVARDE